MRVPIDVEGSVLSVGVDEFTENGKTTKYPYYEVPVNFNGEGVILKVSGNGVKVGDKFKGKVAVEVKVNAHGKVKSKLVTV